MKTKLFALLGLLVIMLLLVIINIDKYGSDYSKVLERLESSNKSIVLLEVTSDGNGLYISENSSLKSGIELLRKRMEREGWTYIKQEGSGVFFKKGKQELIVEVKIWESDYVQYGIQNNKVNIAD